MTRGQSLTAGTGGRGGFRARRLVGTFLPIVAVALLASGCAMKADIRDLRGDLARVDARQDSIFQLLQQQNREILDSLTVTTERLLNVRGQLANQLTELAVQLEQVGQLTAQVQVRLNQLDQQLREAVQNVAGSGIAGGAPGGAPAEGAGAGTFNEAETLYEIGVEQIGRGNAMSARRAFQMVVDSFPSSARAPDAQRQIGETFAMEGDYDAALQAFDRVVERWQDSDAAPLALYRAGVISQERGNIDRARQYFRRVISGYPNSDARPLAEEALRRTEG